MIGNTITYLNSKLSELNLFSKSFGLSELLGKQGKFSPYYYCSKGNYKEVSDIDKFYGMSYWRKRSDVSISNERDPLKACGTLLNLTLPLKLVGSVPKDKLLNDDAYSSDRVVQSIIKNLTKSNSDLKSLIKARKVDIFVSSYSTDRQDIIKKEYPGYEIPDIRYNHTYFSIDFNINILASPDCLIDECPEDGDSLSYIFNGDNELLTFGDILPFTMGLIPVFSVCTSFKVNTTDDAVIIGKWVSGVTSSQSWQISITGGKFRILLRKASGLTVIDGTMSASAGMWYNLTFVFDGNAAALDMVKLYVNGAEDPLNLISGTINDIRVTTAPVAIAANSNNTVNMDGESAWACVTSDLVSLVKNSQLTRFSDPVTILDNVEASWIYDNDTFAAGFIVNDNSGNLLNGTSVNMPETALIPTI